VSDIYRKAAIKAIKKFPWDDYGLDDVDPRSEYAEWVPALADAVVAEIVKALRTERDRQGGMSQP
jgi:hypothetical protein